MNYKTFVKAVEVLQALKGEYPTFEDLQQLLTIYR